MASPTDNKGPKPVDPHSAPTPPFSKVSLSKSKMQGRTVKKGFMDRVKNLFPVKESLPKAPTTSMSTNPLPVEKEESGVAKSSVPLWNNTSKSSAAAAAPEAVEYSRLVEELEPETLYISDRVISMPDQMKARIEARVEAYLFSYISGFITPDNEPQNKMPLMEVLKSELNMSDEEWESNYIEVEKVALKTYVQEAAMGGIPRIHLEDPVKFTDPNFVDVVNALKDGVMKDFPHIKFKNNTFADETVKEDQTNVLKNNKYDLQGMLSDCLVAAKSYNSYANQEAISIKTTSDMSKAEEAVIMNERYEKLANLNKKFQQDPNASLFTDDTHYDIQIDPKHALSSMPKKLPNGLMLLISRLHATKKISKEEYDEWNRWEKGSSFVTRPPLPQALVDHMANAAYIVSRDEEIIAFIKEYNIDPSQRKFA